MRVGAQPIPEAWKPDPPPVIHETLEQFVQRKTQCEDLFELPRTQVDWEILWIWNELVASGKYLCSRDLDKRQRLENAQMIWNMGRKYCWEDHECSFNIFHNILAFAGLEVINPKED